MKKVLIKFRHGLGDAVQLTIVLKHIQQQRKNWIVDVESLTGKHSCFHGLCRTSYRTKRDKINNNYDKVFEVRWLDPNSTPLFDCPATKVTKSLIEEFSLTPDPKLFNYHIAIQNKNKLLAQNYINSLPNNKGFVAIHYQGNTSRSNKNIPEHIIKNVAQNIIRLNYSVVILDWDARSNLSNSKTIFRPGKKEPLWDNTGTGDAGTIAAIIEKAALFIGIDSGPLHVAGSTSTSSIGVWIKHHPIHYFDLANNVKHLVPQNANNFIRSNNNTKTKNYFEQTYRHQYYNNLQKTLLNEVHTILKTSKKTIELQKKECLSSPKIVDSIVLQNQWFGLGSKPDTIFVQ